MIDELHKLLDVHAHLRGFPQFKNLRAHVEERLAKLEAGLEKAPEAPKVVRRVIPSGGD